LFEPNRFGLKKCHAPIPAVPYIPLQVSANPGMGFTDRPVTPVGATKNTDAGFRPYRLRIQQLKISAGEFVFEPPTCNLQLLLEQVRLVPQLCSISSRTCNNPHHNVRADLDRPRIIGVGLPAFLLSKNLYSESIGMSRSTVLRSPFPN